MPCILQLHKLPFSTAHFNFTTAQIVINCTLKYALSSRKYHCARCHREIKRRISMAKEAFSRRKELLRGGLKSCLMKRLVKTLIWSVTLYCAETWTLRKEDIAKFTRLEAFEM